jgi:hypothetical protein
MVSKNSFYVFYKGGVIIMAKKPYYVLVFDNNGNIIDAKLTEEGAEHCTIKKGKEVTAEFLAERFSELTSYAAVDAGGIKLSSNPDCIIYIGNIPICICCG